MISLERREQLSDKEDQQVFTFPLSSDIDFNSIVPVSVVSVIRHSPLENYCVGG